MTEQTAGAAVSLRPHGSELIVTGFGERAVLYTFRADLTGLAFELAEGPAIEEAKRIIADWAPALTHARWGGNWTVTPHYIVTENFAVAGAGFRLITAVLEPHQEATQ